MILLKHIISALLIPFYACTGSINSTPDYTEGVSDYEFEYYIDNIIDDFEKNNIERKELLRNISFKFLSPNEVLSSEYISHCHIDFPEVEKTIYFSEERWNTMDETIRELIILHEIGHCFFGLKDNQLWSDIDDCPYDIMNNQIDIYNKKHYKCLIDKKSQYKGRFYSSNRE